LRIEADGATLFEQDIDGKSPPIEVDVDIADKQRLSIFVDYGDNLDLGDRLHLVEARLVK
jgi:NPCBM/NEW2 domain